MSAALGVGRRDPSRDVVLDFPAGLPKARIEALFDDRVWQRDEGGSEFRRAATVTDPLMFALVYLMHQLVLDREDAHGVPIDLVSLSEWHLDFIQQARRLKSRHPHRTGWVVPRKGAKSTWFDICALWALAHGHRRTIVIFSATQSQVRGHLADLRREFDGNVLLAQDFPELFGPKRMKGDRDTLSTVTRGGGTVAARSIGEQVRGTKFGSDRPDLILLDDVEPDAGAYSIEAKQKRLDTILTSVLPMNEDAAVMLAGTTVMYGSIAHDLVLSALGERHAPWIASTGFVGHYYPAIMGEGTHAERSLWPAMWALGWLKRKRGPVDRVDRTFALEYLNRPEAAGGGLYWTRDDIFVDPHFAAASYVLAIDTAVTQGETSDMTAVAIISVDASGRQMCVEHVFAGRITGTDLREMLWTLKRLNPTLRTAIIEVNQGGSRWREILRPLPEGLELLDGRPDKRGSKRERTEWLLDVYRRGAMVHRGEFTKLVDTMIAWPKVTHDDLLDAVEAGAAFHLGLPIK